MRLPSIATLILCVSLAPAGASAQPSVYIGTAGFTGHGSLCTYPNITCPPSGVEMMNTVTGDSYNHLGFGIAGLGGFLLQDLVVAPDGSRVYAVTREGLKAIDTGTGAVVATLSPAGTLELSPDGSRLYVASSAGPALYVFDTATLTTIATVPLPAEAQDLVRSPDGAYLYASQLLEDTVLRISTASLTIASSFAVDSPAGLGITPDGSRLFVVHMGTQLVSVVDVSAGTTLTTIPTGVEVGTWTRGRVAVSSSTAYISDLGRGVIVLVDVATNASRVVSVKGTARGVALSTDGHELYVATSYGIQVLDPGTGDVLRSHGTDSEAVVVAAMPSMTCSSASAPAAQAFSADGGTAAIHVSAAATCSWAVSGTPSWIVPDVTSGTATGTVQLTVLPTTTPRSRTIWIGSTAVYVQQTVPAIGLDSAGTVTLPATVTGWALDRDEIANGAASSGVDAIHVWAYPASGAPIMLGTASYGLPRPDVVSVYGTRYDRSGFSASLKGLAPGTYTVVFYAHSSRTFTFNAAATLSVVMPSTPAFVAVDMPAPGATVALPFRIAGWAIDGTGVSQPGIDAVHVWAYPAAGGAARFLGGAAYGGARPDVGALFGSGFTNSGYGLSVSALAPGAYHLVVYARSTDTARFDTVSVVPIVVAGSTPLMYVDVPAATATLDSPFTIAGWALDLGAGAGTGVDAVHVWAYPASGASPVFMGAASQVTRPDVAAAYGPRFNTSGFTLVGVLSRGAYDVVVFARSTVTGTFSNVVVLRIVVP